MGTAIAAKSIPGRRAVTLGLAWLVAYFAARALLQLDTLDVWLRVAVALAPATLFAAFLWACVRVVRAMDELERKIQLEALGIAFSLTLLLLTTLALMQRAVSLSFEDWSYAHVWIYLPVFYFGAVALASKRYREDQ